MYHSLEILMATYNGAAYIREQINSILNQTDTEWHLTISDDGSTDNTTAIIDEYVDLYPDKIKRHHANKRFGNARDHFFYLMNNCKADYILFCDQDDVWFPEKVQKIRSALDYYEKEYGSDTPILVYSDMVVVDSKLNRISESFQHYQNIINVPQDYKGIMLYNVASGCAMGINQTLADYSRLCVDTQKTAMHDWWLALIAIRFGKLILLNEPLSYYRQHNNNSVGAVDAHNIWGKIKYFLDIKDMRNWLVSSKQQAELFKNTFKEQLNEEDLAYLTGLTKKKSGFLFFWRYRRYYPGRLFKLRLMILG